MRKPILGPLLFGLFFLVWEGWLRLRGACRRWWLRRGADLVGDAISPVADPLMRAYFWVRKWRRRQQLIRSMRSPSMKHFVRRFEVFCDAAGEWRWRLVSCQNGQVVSGSQQDFQKRADNAMRSAKNEADNYPPGAAIVVKLDAAGEVVEQYGTITGDGSGTALPPIGDGSNDIFEDISDFAQAAGRVSLRRAFKAAQVPHPEAADDPGPVIRVEHADVAALVGDLRLQCHHFPGTRYTVAVAVMPDGFVAGIGTSTCLSAKTFSAEVGERMAKEDAVKNATDKLWELEGYLLRSRMLPLA